MPEAAGALAAADAALAAALADCAALRVYFAEDADVPVSDILTRLYDFVAHFRPA